MTREEAIKRVKGYLTNCLPVDCYEEIEEIIKVLEQVDIEKDVEELKELRVTSCGYSKEDIELNRTAMYNKAIDDFVAEIEKEYDNDYCPNVNDYLDYEISIRDLFKIAEQLKCCGH